jgi:molybdopterin converting factor small subunit
MKVRVNGALLRFTDYRRVITIAAPTVEAALTALADQYQPLRKVLFDREGKVRATHRIFLNGAPLEREELSSPAGDADSIDLLLAISGG